MSTGRQADATICLDGIWEFVAGDDPTGSSVPIEVPSLWEASGHLELDGVAHYRRTFELEDPAGRWTLSFGAVMDEAEVFLNGIPVGAHQGAFTPFTCEVSGRLRGGVNELAVRVTDYAAGDERHLRTAHGKQGWANHVFPSPPSLYMNYGGIWQSVTLERHGLVRIEDIWINSDPDRLTVEIELRGAGATDATLELSLLGRSVARDVQLVDGAATVTVDIGAVDDARWSPSMPVLHEAHAVVSTAGERSHARSLRFGLRKLALMPDGLSIDGRLTKIRSVLVQGFRHDTLYAEGSRSDIEAEVRAAKDAGFNMLRLHIKAFEPRYLDVCDEQGMLVHCDIPVAEPIAHELLDGEGSVADSCARAAREQVRRDRNHPSIVLWSAMNEIGIDALESRMSGGYESFARRLYAEVAQCDPTRPVIENDWIDPDPARVFCSPILTAHWYGRLTASYLADLAAKAGQWATFARPLLVSEFGDWGLPDLEPGVPGFWAYGTELSEIIGASAWEGTPTTFVEGTQRYQGIADRLQIELFRSYPGIAGWCLTELTDVPREFNGLFDLYRKPKIAALQEVANACQTVLPVIRRTSWSVALGTTFSDEVIIVNDGPALEHCRLRVGLGDSEVVADIGPLRAASVSGPIRVSCDVPQTRGTSELELTVENDGGCCGRNAYGVHVIASGPSLMPRTAAVLGNARLRQALEVIGVEPTGIDEDQESVLVVGEGALGPEPASVTRAWLRRGGNVLLLAQAVMAGDASRAFGTLIDLRTEWGSTPFTYTTESLGLPALPTGTVLTTEILEVTPDVVWTGFGGVSTRVETLVGVIKPPPAPVLGTVVGRLSVGAGRLTVCQLRLTDQVVDGSALATALLSELVTYAGSTKEAA